MTGKCALSGSGINAVLGLELKKALIFYSKGVEKPSIVVIAYFPNSSAAPVPKLFPNAFGAISIHPAFLCDINSLRNNLSVWPC
jgi:hypothetical protein